MGVIISLWLVALGAPPLALSGRQGRAEHRQALEARAHDHPEAAFRLAQGLARTQPRAALKVARRAQRLGAHPLRVALLRGDILRGADKLGEAASAYLEVVEAAPHQPYAHLQLWLLLRDGRLPAGIDRPRIRAALVAAGYHLAAQPRRPRDRAAARALVAAGTATLRAGRFTEAAQAFEAAAAQDDDDPVVYAGLAEAYQRLGQPGKAEGARALFVYLEPRDTRAHRVAVRRLDEAQRRRGLDRDREARAAHRQRRRSSR